MISIADILRSYGPAYMALYGGRILPSHKRVIKDIIRCRTEALGGHVYKCPDHEQYAYKYHSCMNRHCPQCRHDQATRWLNNERRRLLKVDYFMVTFTVPKQLRSVFRSNQKLLYGLLFSESWRAMSKLARNPRWLGGLIGALGVLHTWTKVMIFHPHVHYLVPAGGLKADNSVWVRTQDRFFLPVTALSRVFRGMLRDALRQSAPALFATIPASIWRKEWVVHAMPVGDGEAVLKYLAPYVFRVAISNKRIVKLENDQVTFLYKHPETRCWTPMTLEVFEFIRRFLQHVLPRGLKKVRHFGFLASRNKQLLARLQYALGAVVAEPESETAASETETCVPRCPICRKPMMLVDIVPPGGFQLKVNQRQATVAMRSP